MAEGKNWTGDLRYMQLSQSGKRIEFDRDAKSISGASEAGILGARGIRRVNTQFSVNVESELRLAMIKQLENQDLAA